MTVRHVACSLIVALVLPHHGEAPRRVAVATIPRPAPALMPGMAGMAR